MRQPDGRRRRPRSILIRSRIPGRRQLSATGQPCGLPRIRFQPKKVPKGKKLPGERKIRPSTRAEVTAQETAAFKGMLADGSFETDAAVDATVGIVCGVLLPSSRPGTCPECGWPMVASGKTHICRQCRTTGSC